MGIMTTFVFFLILLFSSFCSQYKTLSYSGKKLTKLLDPVGGPAFVYSATKKPQIPEVPEAMYFWSGSGSSATCPMSITFEDQIEITCLRRPIRMYIGADNKFNATFLGTTMKGNDWSSIFSFVLDPTTFVCNGTYTFAITATNTPSPSKAGCSNGNGAGVIYGIAQQYDTGCCQTTEYYSQATCQCYPCTDITPFCLTCTDDLKCLTCFSGYNLKTSQCFPECGNGIRTQDEECDDGNLIKGDGCTASCKIQEYFNCSTILYDKSHCKFDSPLKIYVIQVVKQLYSNDITIIMKIKPNISALETTDFYKITFTSILSNLTYTYYPTGYLFLRYNYSSSLQGNIIPITFNARSIQPEFSDIPNIVVNVQMTTTYNVPIVHYSQEMYLIARGVEKWYSVIVYFTIIIFLVSVASNKIIGVEVLRVFQISFFSLGCIDYAHPLLTALSDFRWINGYNLQFEQNQMKVPDRIRGIQYSENIYSNNNITLGLVYFVGAVGLVAYLIRNTVGKRYRLIVEDIWKVMIQENLLMLGLGQCLNLGFTCGIQILYGDFNFNNTIIFILSLFLISFIFINTLYYKSKNQFQKALKNNRESQSYPLLSIIYATMMGVTMSLLNSTFSVCFIVFALSCSFLIYHISVLPFKKPHFNYLAGVTNTTVAIILLFRMLYKSQNASGYATSESWILFTGISQVLLLSMCVVLSIYCLISQIHSKITKKSPTAKQKQQKQQKLPDQSVLLSNDKTQKTLETDKLETRFLQ